MLEYNGTTGAFVTAFVGAGSGGLALPIGLVFGPNGNLFVSSDGTDQVLEYNGTTGAFVTAFVGAGSGGLGFPTPRVPDLQPRARAGFRRSPRAGCFFLFVIATRALGSPRHRQWVVIVSPEGETEAAPGPRDAAHADPSSRGRRHCHRGLMSYGA